MSRPIKNPQFTGATSTGKGSPVRQKGHNSLGLFVATSNLDTANDTVEVRVEVSPNGDDWSEIREQGNDRAVIKTGDLDENGNGAVKIHGAPFEWFRARIVTLDDAANSDLTVDAWIFAGNNAQGAGHSGSRH